ncbi:hypothetical protein Q4511_00315 [Paracoccus sp. 1_MG-2023]|uniref:hypothetical protein n=1 Tax=unclassified Paracoccus (in: a-proteobacteria) TaxID=2688777 RepID=UPI001C082517|nr:MULTISPECIES: hypothetical protein [unclassified Paracoccus (in: a-proteobacteria)]MBU2957799.1 hypothetical protein [Paracoccus sp. C2R09]MDO6667352.1 hypothetical protein [Paracoccus sp. 1_MG-2023]
MSEKIIDLGNGFWNIRGDLRLGGVLNVGTHASLVQLGSGEFVMLDSYPLSGDIRDQVMALTDQGRAVTAVLNLHPYHTLHCKAVARDFPQARLYGTERHRAQHPDLAWQPTLIDTPEAAAIFASDLVLTVPRGIDHTTENDRVHAGSVLAWHPASASLHVDDTLNILPVPGPLKRVFGKDKLIMHPTMPKALTADPDCIRELTAWIDELAEICAGLRNLCAAHNGIREFRAGEFAPALRDAFQRSLPGLQKAMQP